MSQGPARPVATRESHDGAWASVMTFSPVVPTGGLVGWSLLDRTMERQTELFNKSPQIVRDTEYFEKTIDTIKTAEDLVADRRLLRVALGAFGLQDQINSKAFIRKI